MLVVFKEHRQIGGWSELAWWITKRVLVVTSSSSKSRVRQAVALLNTYLLLKLGSCWFSFDYSDALGASLCAAHLMSVLEKQDVFELPRTTKAAYDVHRPGSPSLSTWLVERHLVNMCFSDLVYLPLPILIHF